MTSEIIIDIESNGFIFESTKIWTIHALNYTTGEKFSVNPFTDREAKDKLLQFLFKNDGIPRIIFHNGLGFDIFVLRNILNIQFSVGPDFLNGAPVQFVDTFYLSMFLNPDRERHSIEYFGDILGFPKLDYRQELIDMGVLDKNAPDGEQFKFYNRLMEEYCETDVEVNLKTYLYLKQEWEEIYGKQFEITDAFKCGQKSFFLMSCQELTGWKFDLDAALVLKDRISEMMEEIRLQVEPQLPPRPLKKTEEKEYTMPAKPYKADGTFSSHMLKFIEKHRGEIISEGKIKFYGKEYSVVSKAMLDVKMPMEMANQDQMKEWFLSMGWEPTFYNFKRGPDGKPVRDPLSRQLIKTTPKIQEQGRICPNLEEMETGIVKEVVKWLSLRNRQSVLQGWIDNPRLQMDGRIGAGRTGIASTHRQKHKVVVNVPKASDKVLLGKEFRSLWTSEPGFKIAAGDAAALEGRVQGHYVWKYDGGITAKELLEGDIHSKTAISVYGDELAEFDISSPDFDKEHPKFKPYRDRSKNVFYACLPMDTKVLTKSGWKFYEEISEGDTVLTFNEKTGIVEDDVVLRKHFFTNKEVIEYSNKFDSFRCTEDHRWYGWRRSKTKGKPSQKVFGWFEANQFTQEHNIVLTAPWKGNEDSKLSKDDCSLLGWLASDGTWSWSKKSETTSSSFGKKKNIHCSISQSNSKFWREIEILLDRMGIEYHKNTTNRENGNNVHYYTLKSKSIRSFLDRIFNERKDKHDVDWVSLILSMSRENLESFYDSFYKGDGQVKGSGEIITQNLGNIFDAVVTAAQLLGKGRLSFNRKVNTYSPMKSVRVQKRRHITCQEVCKKSLGVQDTFCLTTKNSSFIIWQDDFIGITGNCLYGAGDAKLASTAGLPESKGKEVSEKFWAANEGTKKLKDALERYWETRGKKKYLPAIDGRILLTRKKSALLNTIFQSCGGIIMDYAACFMDMWLGEIYWDELNRPYYLYKGFVVKRIGYFHDELEYECEDEIAEEVSKMIEKAIIKAGEYLKIKVPLAGEGKVGETWKEVH